MPFSAHDEREKRRNWFFRRPAVHHGFQRSWRANGLSRRVVDRVSQIAAEATLQGHRLRVVTTGGDSSCRPSVTLAVWPTAACAAAARSPCFACSTACPTHRHVDQQLSLLRFRPDPNPEPNPGCHRRPQLGRRISHAGCVRHHERLPERGRCLLHVRRTAHRQSCVCKVKLKKAEAKPMGNASGP